MNNSSKIDQNGTEVWHILLFKSILIAKLPKKLLLYKIKAQLNGAVSKEKMPKTDNFYALDNAMTTILTTNLDN